MDIDQIIRIIKNGRINIAIEHLIANFDFIQHEQIRDDILLQSSRLKTISRDKNLGKISDETASIEINKITKSILLIINELKEDFVERDESESLVSEISSIVSRQIKSFPSNNKENLIHQVNLYKIHKENLIMAEEACAKWGELVPPIITHRIKNEKEKTSQIISQINSLL